MTSNVLLALQSSMPASSAASNDITGVFSENSSKTVQVQKALLEDLASIIGSIHLA